MRASQVVLGRRMWGEESRTRESARMTSRRKGSHPMCACAWKQTKKRGEGEKWACVVSAIHFLGGELGLLCTYIRPEKAEVGVYYR